MRRRVAAVALVLLAVVLIGQIATRGVPGFRAGPRLPQGSSYATGPTGLSQYAGLLSRAGHTVVRRRVALDVDTPVDPADALVVLDAQHLAPEEGRAIGRFVAAGGRAVVGGLQPNAWLPDVIDDPPTWVPGGQAACHTIEPVPEASGVTDVVFAPLGRQGSGHFEDQAGTLAFLACQGRISATVASPDGAQSSARLVLLSDSGPLQNRFLGARDDSRFGLDLVADRRTVVFAEEPHGFGVSAGVFGLPTRGGTAVAVALLALVAGAAAVAATPRAGGPEPAPLSAGRLSLARALGRRLERSRPAGPAAIPLQRAARAALARRAGLPPSAESDPQAMRAAAAAAGLDPDLARALVEEPRRRGDVVAAAKALAALQDT